MLRRSIFPWWTSGWCYAKKENAHTMEKDHERRWRRDVCAQGDFCVQQWKVIHMTPGEKKAPWFSTALMRQPLIHIRVQDLWGSKRHVESALFDPWINPNPEPYLAQSAPVFSRRKCAQTWDVWLKKGGKHTVVLGANDPQRVRRSACVVMGKMRSSSSFSVDSYVCISTSSILQLEIYKLLKMDLNAQTSAEFSVPKNFSGQLIFAIHDLHRRTLLATMCNYNHDEKATMKLHSRAKWLGFFSPLFSWPRAASCPLAWPQNWPAIARVT